MSDLDKVWAGLSVFFLCILLTVVFLACGTERRMCILHAYKQAECIAALKVQGSIR